VTERNTGTLNFGLGYSAAEKLTVQASVSQANILGTGNMVAFQVNNGAVNKVYSVTYINPYWTADGISRGFDFFRRDVDTAALSGVAGYQTTSTGLGVRFGVPVTEFDSINLGVTGERTVLSIDPSIAPARYTAFIQEFGNTTNTLRTNISFSRDTRDSLTWPTRGWLNEIGLEIGIPPGDLKYYRATYQSQFFYTPERQFSWLTLLLNGEVGYAQGFGGKPLPFFKNFYAGGVGSVRGYETATVGPRDLNGDVLGGNRRVVANAELLFPLPGYKEKNVRLGLFFDLGNVWGTEERLRVQDLRYSTGLAVSWDSPVGPLRFSFGLPLRTRPEDKIERFQFQLGKIF
jgi:outer membrane protein insertion porin family